MSHTTESALRSGCRLLLLMMSLSCAEVRSEIDGPPIVDNNYNLDLRQGPVMGSSRQVALGGAYIGVAEGIASLNSNPAGVAFRLERSTTRFDWDWTAGLTNLDSKDFDNNGVTPPDYKSHRIRSLGLMGQYGPWGLGVLNNAEIIALENPDDDDSEYVLSVTSLRLGRQFLDRELTIGVGLHATTSKLRTETLDATLGQLSGVGWDVGALWNPERGPWRFGASFSSSILTDELDNPGDTPVTVNGLVVPHQVILPATFGMGASYAVESAPFWKDHKWLVSGDLLYTESSDNAVGVESVLAQRIQPVGTHDTISVRVGSELEAIPGRLRLRLGSYYEPSNYEGVSSRTHVTGGFEVRLFHTSLWGEYDWSLTATVDSARDYLNVLVSIGFWYF
ncbi:hypothetical protein HNQ60_005131 [Povalibacter uvarum]|uniref:Uncharacterized protein n=1 Tax=Povalibacter uvarum TaxID=732238 RepID=A0A841HVC6_9GAMM|nr:hypothetical protein [Povalibacter uvarum]MBB6096209.1 hypothetical protein [Povalibacter uvarum]